MIRMILVLLIYFILIFCKAGIPTKQLTVCLEPEAISLYSQHAPATNLMGNPDTKPLLSFKPGTKYMIIDLGGNY